jgi:deleted-in-malignant-brain-tumors protein 1
MMTDVDDSDPSDGGESDAATDAGAPQDTEGGSGEDADDGSGDDAGVEDGGGTGDDGGMADAGMNADGTSMDGGSEDGGGGMSCASGLTRCDGKCVDLKTNADYCGGCNTSCGAAEVCDGGSCAERTSELVLSEVSNREPRFFEVYNGGTSPIDLQGWKLQWQTNDGDSGTTVLSSQQLGSDEFVAIYSDVDEAPDGAMKLDSELPNFQSIGVRLLDPSSSGADFVRTGNSSVSPGPGDNWNAQTTPANPSSTIDQSLVRSVYEPDTDSGNDWHLTAPSSAGEFCPRAGKCGTECVDQSSNRNHCGGCGISCGSGQICREGQCTTANNHLWLTEYRRYPAPGVEIQNPTAQPIDLDNYRLEVGSSAYTFSSRTLQPGEFLFVSAGSGTDGERVVFSGIDPRNFTYDQYVSLLNTTGDGLDFIRFEDSTASPPSGTSWFGDGISAPSGQNVSARRDTKILDSDSSTDWVIDSPSTPGVGCGAEKTSCSGKCVDLEVDRDHCGTCGNTCADRETCKQGSCVSAGSVVLSELHDGTTEYIELHNGRASQVDLSGWKIEWTGGNGSGSHEIPSGTSVDSGDFWVFEEGGGTQIRWGDGIAVSLIDASGNGVDFVRTGTASTSAPSGTSWSGQNATDPSTDEESLVRSIYEPDTDAADDWSIRELDSGQDPSKGSYCPAGKRTCGTNCVAEGTRENCGACGRSCPTSNVCRDGTCDRLEGAVRLVGGDNNDDGRLEINHNGRWETVCDVAFDSADATVVCQQLGFSSGNVTFPPDDTGSRPLMTRVDCSGGEGRLTECSFDWDYRGACRDYDDVGIECF